MKPRLAHLTLALASLGTLLGAAALLFALRTPRLAYADTVKVFNGFAMRTELERDFVAASMGKQRRLDSLAAAVDTLTARAMREGATASADRMREIGYLRQEYAELENATQGARENQKAQLQQQIWAQLNQYLKDYGASSGYDFILGADASGNILYGTAAHDVTDEVLGYVNKRYNDEPQ